MSKKLTGIVIIAWGVILFTVLFSLVGIVTILTEINRRTVGGNYNFLNDNHMMFGCGLGLLTLLAGLTCGIGLHRSKRWAVWMFFVLLLPVSLWFFFLGTVAIKFIVVSLNIFLVGYFVNPKVRQQMR